MRPTTNIFLVDGLPLLVPDEEPSFSYEDIDAHDAGRDAAGYMHRHRVREQVGKWSFDYKTATEAERQYIERIFEGKDTFQFTRPSRLDLQTPETSECYRSKHSAKLKNYRLQKWVGYTFNIIEC